MKRFKGVTQTLGRLSGFTKNLSIYKAISCISVVRTINIMLSHERTRTAPGNITPKDITTLPCCLTPFELSFHHRIDSMPVVLGLT